ncbi:hypothetical protein GCM10022224_089780 [Nonomuraea antimicrobica]|uniref:Uncharacterized protein n=1 Tax=Nonomuraea antimicrobica TaxID=561173 RepID=A0ABP7DUH0_9ACTN
MNAAASPTVRAGARAHRKRERRASVSCSTTVFRVRYGAGTSDSVLPCRGNSRTATGPTGPADLPLRAAFSRTPGGTHYRRRPAVRSAHDRAAGRGIRFPA